MPAPVEELLAPPTTAVDIRLEPALNALHSLLLLAMAEKVSGFNEWVSKTIEALSPEEKHKHNLVMMGFYFAVLPQQSWESFPAYLEHLDALDPVALRDKLMNAYARIKPCNPDGTTVAGFSTTEIDLQTALSSPQAYLEFLQTRFDASHIGIELELEAYQYVSDPPAMQTLIVSHLRGMWEQYYAQEWRRIKPLLTDSARAFQQLNLTQMDKMEALQLVSGKDMRDDPLSKKVDLAERVIFVPNAHIGPYLAKYKFGDDLVILFGARLPEGTQVVAPDLSRADILVRLSALADDTRLHILKFISDEGEQRSQDIMELLDLSQSASSRHLSQLSAAGYLKERRCNGAKCYNINSERVEDTLSAISSFLLHK